MAERIEERSRTSSYLLSSQPTENAKTRQATNYGVKLFRDYCLQRGIHRIDLLNEDDIAKLLKGFYADVRTKDGQRFSVNSLIAIRYALSRFYYRLPHLNRRVDIVRGGAFEDANQTFRNVLKELESQSRTQSGCQRISVNSDDRHKLRHYFVHAIHTPRGLLHKVWYDLMLQIGRKGRDGQRMLSRTSFAIGSTPDGRQYVYQNDGEDDGNNVIWESPGDLLCPVKNFKAYLSRLNPACEALFQRPKDRISKQDLCWYVNSPVGKNMLATMMSTISKCAALSRIYTNIRIRATMYSEAQENGCISCEISPPLKNSIETDNLTPEIGNSRCELPNDSALFISSSSSNGTRNTSYTVQEDKSLFISGPQQFVKSSAAASMIKIASTTSLSVFPVALSRACPDSLQSSANMQHSDKVTQSSSLQGLNRNRMILSQEIKSQDEQSENTNASANNPNQQEHINKCATCNTILKNQAGILLTAGRLGKRLFCSTGCLGQWVAQDNSKSLATSSASSLSSSSSSSSTTAAALPACDYCQTRQPAKYHLIGDNGVVQKFCSNDCMMYFKNSSVNGRYGNFPWVTGNNKASCLPSTNGPVPVISSVVSLSNESTMPALEEEEESFEEEDGDISGEEEDRMLSSPALIVPEELPASTMPSTTIRKHRTMRQASSHTIPRSVHSLLPRIKYQKQDQAVGCKPEMMSVSVLCKPNTCNVAIQVGPVSSNKPVENGVKGAENSANEQESNAINSEVINGGNYRREKSPLRLDIYIDEDITNNTSVTNTVPKTAAPHIISLNSYRCGRMSRKMSWDDVAQRSKLQTMWAVKLFRDWLQCRKHLQPDFENMPPAKLGEMLQEFYSSLKKPDGDDYSVSTFHSIRASINRYLSLPPHSKPFSIIRGRDFQCANESFFKRVKRIQHNNWCPPQSVNSTHLQKRQTALGRTQE